jgi:hypothetical protein
MARFDTPEGKLAEALAESPLYAHTVQMMADSAWSEARGYRGRLTKLSARLQEWMRSRVPKDDAPPLEILFLSLAIERFDWPIVAEIVAEELGMPGT